MQMVALLDRLFMWKIIFFISTIVCDGINLKNFLDLRSIEKGAELLPGMFVLPCLIFNCWTEYFKSLAVNLCHYFICLTFPFIIIIRIRKMAVLKIVCRRPLTMTASDRPIDSVQSMHTFCS